MLHVFVMSPYAKDTQSARNFYQEFKDLIHASFILLKGPQIMTFLYIFSTLQPPFHTKRHSSYKV
jgi:hypothetical protein